MYHVASTILNRVHMLHNYHKNTYSLPVFLLEDGRRGGGGGTRHWKMTSRLYFGSYSTISAIFMYFNDLSAIR